MKYNDFVQCPRQHKLGRIKIGSSLDDGHLDCDYMGKTVFLLSSFFTNFFFFFFIIVGVESFYTHLN